jgi:hypothetical protein
VIGAKRVTAPDGTAWRVGRRWLPRKPVLWGKRPSGRDWFFPDIGLGDADGVFAAALALGQRQIEPSEALRATP